MTDLGQDVRFALRMLRRSPWFGIAVIGTLALGIGANTALFSVVQSVLLAPLPYAEPDRVAMIWSRWEGFEKTWVSEGEYHNYRASLRSFEDLGLFGTFEVNVTEGDEPARVLATAVTPNVFEVVGVEPQLGRGFREEEAVENGPAVVVLSYELWQRRYGGDASVLGGTISVNGTLQQVIGVMPAGFKLPLDYKSDQPTELWLPNAVSSPTGAVPPSGGSHGSYAIGRLRPGVTVEAANAEVRALVDRLNADGIYPPEMRFTAFVVSAVDEIAGLLKPALMVLLGAVAFVLLIACANVANLLLVRGEDRRREVGVRAALGADRRRLVGQLLVENLAMAVVGGVVGVWLAWIGIALLRALAPSNLPRIPDTAIDGRVLAFTALLSLVTAVLFGLLPALRGAKTELHDVLKEGGRANTGDGARHRMRRLLVGAELALAVVLAIGAGLMLRSFWRLIDLDPGFEAENVLTMRLSTPSAFYPEEADVAGFYDDLLRSVRTLPGVETAGLVRVLPIDQEIGDSCITIEGYVPPPGQCAPADWQAASDGYFEALGLQLVEGRFIEPTDTRDAAQVIVVNEEFVSRYIADGRALGKRVRFGFTDGTPDQTIVGVVGDARHNGLTGEIKATFYRPHAQWAVSTGFPQRSMSLVVRTSRDANALAGPVRAEIRALDPRLPVSRVQLMEDVLSRAVAQPRFTLALLLGFGGLAILLAVVGIYGVVSYAVAARRHELGIRMALGATPRAVVWLSLRQGLAFAVGGVLVGTAGAVGATRLMRNLVYGVETTDPATYLAVGLLGLLVAFMAAWLPARRAGRADPLRALRAE